MCIPFGFLQALVGADGVGSTVHKLLFPGGASLLLALLACVLVLLACLLAWSWQLITTPAGLHLPVPTFFPYTEKPASYGGYQAIRGVARIKPGLAPENYLTYEKGRSDRPHWRIHLSHTTSHHVITPK
jgi:hypothetical protein